MTRRVRLFWRERRPTILRVGHRQPPHAGLGLPRRTQLGRRRLALPTDGRGFRTHIDRQAAIPGGPGASQAFAKVARRSGDVPSEEPHPNSYPRKVIGSNLMKVLLASGAERLLLEDRNLIMMWKHPVDVTHIASHLDAVRKAIDLIEPISEMGTIGVSSRD
jgi:hypothetical protein